MAALMDPCQKNWLILENYVLKVPDVEKLEDTFVLDENVPNPTTKQKLILNEMKQYNISSGNSSEEPLPKKDVRIEIQLLIFL